VPPAGVYVDVPADKASSASSIASTMQQLSISFGVAAAGLITVFFIPSNGHAGSSTLIQGLHEAFLALGAFTILSTAIFYRLKGADGEDETEQKDIHLG